MADRLHYPGNHVQFDPGHTYGPDMFGAYYRPVDAHHDPVLDRTTIELLVVPPAELPARLSAHMARAYNPDGARVAELFGGWR